MNELEKLAGNEAGKTATKTFDGTVIGMGIAGDRFTVRTQAGTVIRNVPGTPGTTLGAGVVIGNNSPGTNKFSIFNRSYKTAKDIIIAEV